MTTNNYNDILKQLSRPVEDLAKDAGVTVDGVDSFVDEVLKDKTPETIIYEVKSSVEEQLPKKINDIFIGNGNEAFRKHLIEDLKASTDPELAVFAKLIEDSGDIDAKNEKGCTGLHVASLHSKYFTEQFLLASASPDIGDNGGHTVLHLACSRKDKDNIELFIKFGANPFITNNRGNTPIHCLGGDEPVLLDIIKDSIKYRKKIEELYKLFEDTGKPQYSAMLAQMDDNLETLHFGEPLLYHFADENKDIVNALINAGANVNHCNKEGISPLMKAASKGYYISAEYLLNAGADIDVRDKDGNNAAMLADKSGNPHIAKLINTKYLTKDFLKAVASSGLAEVADLIEHENDIDAKDSHGFTIIHKCALNSGNLPLMNECFEYGANVNAISDKLYATPLMCAASTGNYPGAKVLIKSGAHINNKTQGRGYIFGFEVDTEGLSAYDIAEMQGYSDIMELIKSCPYFEGRGIIGNVMNFLKSKKGTKNNKSNQ